MPARLDPFRQLLRQQVLPRYEELGSLAFGYMQGSLVSGYTDRAISGFYYGELLVDRAGQGQQTKAALHSFPAALKSETARRARGHREANLTHLRTFAERADWFMFHKDLIEAVRMVVQALFSAAEVYYPGDKWLRQAIVRFGLDPRVLAAFDQLWEQSEDHRAKITALEQLLLLATEPSDRQEE